jgi:prephenate dehydrogenase
MSDVLVVGCGLLGTSIGLALRGSPQGDVTLWDASDTALGEAAQRGAGRAWDGIEPAGLVVVCVPPTTTAATLIDLQRRDIASTYTHVSSSQTHVQAEIEILSPNPSLVVGGHPLAGREISGAGAAVADLFVGRPWAVCATPISEPRAISAVRELAELCGGQPLETTPETHDAAVALTSHLPQVAASALAGVLLAHAGGDPSFTLALSGPGLADTTRLAASNPELWREVLGLNAGHVAPVIRALAASLDALADSLTTLHATSDPRQRADAEAALMRFLERGREGRALVPVKRGEVAGAFAGVRVELADAPGELARVLIAAGEAGVNVEDLRVEHVPGRPRGVVELLVSPGGEGPLGDALRRAGWQVFMSTDRS